MGGEVDEVGDADLLIEIQIARQSGDDVDVVGVVNGGEGEAVPGVHASDGVEGSGDGGGGEDGEGGVGGGDEVVEEGEVERSGKSSGAGDGAGVVLGADGVAGEFDVERAGCGLGEVADEGDLAGGLAGVDFAVVEDVAP